MEFKKAVANLGWKEPETQLCFLQQFSPFAGFTLRALQVVVKACRQDYRFHPSVLRFKDPEKAVQIFRYLDPDGGGLCSCACTFSLRAKRDARSGVMPTRLHLL